MSGLPCFISSVEYVDYRSQNVVLLQPFKISLFSQVMVYKNKSNLSIKTFTDLHQSQDDVATQKVNQRPHVWEV